MHIDKTINAQKTLSMKESSSLIIDTIRANASTYFPKFSVQTHKHFFYSSTYRDKGMKKQPKSLIEKLS